MKPNSSTDLILSPQHNDNFKNACTTLSKSSLVPPALRGKPSDIYLIGLTAYDLNIPLTQALNSIHIISGNPTISGQMMLALIRSKFQDAFISIKSENGIIECTMARDKKDKEDSYTSVWDINRAKKMGIAGKDNWIKQPETMLKWRAVSESARMVFPDVLKGLYTPDEIEGVDLEENAFGIDADFPIPEEEKKPGLFYRFQNGKFRGHQLKDCDPDDLADYQITLEKRLESKGLKKWEQEVLNMITDYIDNYESYHSEIIEVKSE